MAGLRHPPAPDGETVWDGIDLTTTRTTERVLRKDSPSLCFLSSHYFVGDSDWKGCSLPDHPDGTLLALFHQFFPFVLMEEFLHPW
jgi:hypothetical protein